MTGFAFGLRSLEGSHEQVFMSRERFQQIEKVFDAAADVPTNERGVVLDRLCRDDPALRAEVEALLAASLDATPLIRGVIGRVADEVVSLAPRRIGPYRLQRELGHGGMGTVYLAVRDDDEYRGVQP